MSSPCDAVECERVLSCNDSFSSVSLIEKYYLQSRTLTVKIITLQNNVWQDYMCLVYLKYLWNRLIIHCGFFCDCPKKPWYCVIICGMNEQYVTSTRCDARLLDNIRNISAIIFFVFYNTYWFFGALAPIHVGTGCCTYNSRNVI